jgi:O-antigen/teichoic acid export membrane protein
MESDQVVQELATLEGDSSSSVHLARNAMHLVFGQAATMVLGILFSAMLGRRLGTADFGLYFLINSLAAFVFLVVDWGQQ